MNIPDLQEKARRLLVDNASSVLTAGGVVGTVTTAVLTGRATVKAVDIIREKELEEIENEPEDIANKDTETMGLSTGSKVKLVWPYYVPPVVVGSATIASIVMANRISLQRAAALAAAYGISEGRLQEYKEKVAEKLTGPKKQAIEDEIAQDRVNANPPSKEVIILAGGDVLCYDMLTGRYFRSSVEQIKKAEATINHELFEAHYASASQFYDELGLPATTVTDTLGWNGLQDGVLEVKLSTVMSPDQKPCIAIDFSHMPQPNYGKMFE